MPISMWEKSGNEESLTNSVPSIAFFFLSEWPARMGKRLRRESLNLTWVLRRKIDGVSQLSVSNECLVRPCERTTGPRALKNQF